MEATASAKYLRGSAQKARLVVDMIRGKDVNQALAILRFSKKRAATGIEKCMRSAIANANEAAEKANVSIDPDDLWVRTALSIEDRPRIDVAYGQLRRGVHIVSRDIFATLQFRLATMPNRNQRLKVIRQP